MTDGPKRLSESPVDGGEESVDRGSFYAMVTLALHEMHPDDEMLTLGATAAEFTLSEQDTKLVIDTVEHYGDMSQDK